MCLQQQQTVFQLDWFLKRNCSNATLKDVGYIQSRRYSCYLLYSSIIVDFWFCKSIKSLDRQGYRFDVNTVTKSNKQSQAASADIENKIKKINRRDLGNIFKNSSRMHSLMTKTYEKHYFTPQMMVTNQAPKTIHLFLIHIHLILMNYCQKQIKSRTIIGSSL